MEITASEKESGFRLPLKDFIQLSGVTEITSEAIFFAPNIPRDKLENALAAYGSSVSQKDVVILIDDTFWGSAKEGILVTTDALLFNEKGKSPRRAKLEILRNLASRENQIILNGKNVGSLGKAGKLELGYVFSVLNDYVGFSARDTSSRKKNTLSVSKVLVSQLCARFITPQYVQEKQGSSFPKPATTPGYYVGDAMPESLAKMARFSLGLHEREEIIAARDLTRHGTGLGCFVVTTEGVYAKREKEFEITYLPWHVFKDLKVVSEHKESYLRGVVLSNGQVLVTSWENAVVLPFGVKLINELISLVAGDAVPIEAHQPFINVLPADEDVELETESVFENEPVPAGSQVIDLEHINAKDLPLAKENTPKEVKLKSTFIDAISNTIKDNWPKITELLKEKTGEASISALRNDQHVETLAQYLYTFLPAVIRLAIKEDVFVRFMLDNRDRILEQLTSDVKDTQGSLEGEGQKATALLIDQSASVDTPRKRLSRFKTGASESKAFFVKLQSELQARRDQLEVSATGGAGAENAAQYCLIDLQARILGLALGLPAYLRRARLLANNDEFGLLSSDKVTLRVLAYCFASIAHLLTEEAEFDRAKLNDFLTPLEEAFLLPYLNGAAPKRLKMLVQPANESQGNAALLDFKAEVEALSAHIYRDDMEAVAEIFIGKVVEALGEESHPLCSKLQAAHDELITLLNNINEQQEEILVDYLEQTGLHQ